MEDSTLEHIVEHNDDCLECGGRLIQDTEHTKEFFCEECGLVSEEVPIDFGRGYRRFTPEDESKVHDGKIDETRHDKGMGSDIRGMRDATGKPVTNTRSVKQLQFWNRRSKISHKNSERSLSAGLIMLKQYISQEGLSKNLYNESVHIYKKAVKENFLRGRSIELVLAASLMAGCKRGGFPRTLDEIADITKMPRKRIGSVYKYLNRELKLNLKTSDPQDYIPRFCSELKMDGPKVANEAYYILKQFDERGEISGKSPTGLAISAIYIATVACNERRTQRECAEVAKVTEVTIRNRYKDIIAALPEYKELKI